MRYEEESKKLPTETSERGQVAVSGNGGSEPTVQNLQALLARLLAVTPQPDSLAELQWLIADYKRVLKAVGATQLSPPQNFAPATNPKTI
jgi:hypothetical protein